MNKKNKKKEKERKKENRIFNISAPETMHTLLK